MYILNQEGDLIELGQTLLKTKTPKGIKLYTLYAPSGSNLLGYFDTEESEQVCEALYAAISAGKRLYRIQ